MKMLTAVAVAAAFAMPLCAGAADKAASTSPSASANPGAEKMFQALDKNKDGSLSKEEVKGTPHDKEFATLDKNHDGKLSKEEHAAAPEHAGGKSSAMGATGGASGAGTQKKDMK